MCVEGLNCKFDLRGKTDDFPGIMQRKEQPLNVLTDLKLVDPSDKQVFSDFLKSFRFKVIPWQWPRFKLQTLFLLLPHTNAGSASEVLELEF